MIGEIGDLEDRLFFAVFGADDDLGALFSHLFEYLVQALFEEIGRVRALLGTVFSALYEFIERVEGKGLVFRVHPDGVFKAGIRAQMAGGTVLYHLDGQRV